MASIHDILRPITFTKVVSRQSAASSMLLNWFGMQVGGPNERFYGHGREGSYHVFNHLRSTALEVAPGAPAARRGRQPVGRVPFVYPRMHEEFSLPYEEIHNFAKIDDPAQRDLAGEAYIRLQSRGPGERHANWRTTLLVGMLRDSLYLHESGNYWYPNYTSSGALLRRNFQLPAGNLDQLNITDIAGTSIYGGNILDVPWSSAGANIPLQLQRASAAIFRRHGLHLRHVFLRTEEWDKVTNNSYVTAGAGISNPPFQNYERQVGTNPDGSPKMFHTGKVNKLPGWEFHIYDDGRDVGYPGSETWAYDLEDEHVLLLPEPTGDVFEGLTGSEPIVEYDNGPVSVKTGFAAWALKASNPSSYQSFILDNFLPCPYMPGSWCYADTEF